MEAAPSDPVIDEVRAARHRISKRVGHDSARLVAYYRELQGRYQGPLLRSGMAGEPTTGTGAASGGSGTAAASCARRAQP